MSTNCNTINVLNKMLPSKFAKIVNECINLSYTVSEISTLSSFYAVEGMSGKKYRFFINNLIHSLGPTSYLEIGCCNGSTFCSAINGNDVYAVAIDNWSEFDGPREKFKTNLRNFATPSVNVRLIEQDFRSIDFSTIGLFDVFMFDGPHERQDHYDGITLPYSALNDEFVLIIDDWNWPNVREGTLSAIQDLQLEILYAAEIRTSINDQHPEHAYQTSDWHNGYYVAVLRKCLQESHSNETSIIQ